VLWPLGKIEGEHCIKNGVKALKIASFWVWLAPKKCISMEGGEVQNIYPF